MLAPEVPHCRLLARYHLEQFQVVMSEATARSGHLLEPSVMIARRSHNPYLSKTVRLRIG